MAGRGDPPEGTPEDIPGGDDEYRSVVFDESFVRAARIQEFSATERMGADARAVRPRRVRGTVSHQAFALMLVIALAFGMAVYLGMRNPYRDPAPPPSAATRLAITLVPLAPAAGSRQPRGKPGRLLDKSPAAHYRSGAGGVTLPAARRTEHFSESQVLQALTGAKDYLVASSLNPEVLFGRQTRSVRRLLDPDQLAQFDRSVDQPADDGEHSATGWMVRFDPRRTALADPHIRVYGSIEVHEVGGEVLHVRTDHTFVYAVRAATAAPDSVDAVLFTVRREVEMRFDRAALRDSYLTLASSATEAGPQRCGVNTAEYFQPVLPGEAGGERDPGTKRPGERDTGTNPYDRGRPVAAACGILSTGS